MNSPLSENSNDSDNDFPDEYKDVFSSKNWIFEKKYTNSENAIQYLKSQQLWDIDQKKCCAVAGGYKAMYRCNYFGDSVTIHCSATKCIFFPNTSSEVLVFRSQQSHEHVTKLNKKYPDALDKKTIARYKQLVELKIKSNEITKQLQFEGFQFNPQQLRRAILKSRRKQDDIRHDDWTIEKKFDCVDATKEYLDTQKIWSLKSQNLDESGTSRCHYRCNKVPRNGPQCAAKMYFVHNQSTDDVILYRNNAWHTHDSLPSRQSESLGEEHSEEEIDVPPLDSSSSVASSSSKSMVTQDDDLTEFKFKMSFVNIATAEEYLREITSWRKMNKIISQSGLKEYYCCNLENESGKKCPAQLYLLHAVDEIRLYRNDHLHTHNEPEPDDNVTIEDGLIGDDNEEIILNYDDCDDIIMDEVPTNELIGEEIIIGDFVDENQFAIEVNGDEWMYQKKFANHEQAIKYLENRYMVLVNKQEVPLGGFQEYHRCGLITNSNETCPVISYIEYFDKLTDVLLYKNMLTQHSHDEVLPLSCVQPADNIIQTSIKPTIVRGVNLKTIEKWLKSIAFVPNHDDDKPFCANYTIDHTNQMFQCFITTKRLLKIALESRVVHADFKCTLSWQTYNILIVGTTDMDQTFHSFGVAVVPTKSEKDYEFLFRSLNIGISMCFSCDFKPEMLISNSKSTIQNAFVAVYGVDQSKLITCFNYMLAEISTSLKAIVLNETIRNEIICDIRKIQKVPSPEIFLEAIILFVKKWGTTHSKFIEYFKMKWIQKNTNWYIGVSHYTASTNEAIVQEYQRIINEYNFKNNQNFAILKSFLDHVVDTWSNAYGKKTKIFAQKPTISLALYDEACQWNALQTQIDIEEIDTDTTYYYVPSEIMTMSQEKLAKYKSKFHLNLAELFDVQFSFWELKQIKNADITCSCPYFFQHYICKHSLGMATALNLYKFSRTIPSQEFKKEEDDECDSEGEVILS